jgi:transcriptional regulator with XRE-family HTH domain
LHNTLFVEDKTAAKIGEAIPSAAENRLEKGKTNVTIGTLNQIAKLLEVPIQKLFDWD